MKRLDPDLDRSFFRYIEQFAVSRGRRGLPRMRRAMLLPWARPMRISVRKIEAIITQRVLA